MTLPATISVGEAAELLGVSTDAVYDSLKAGSFLVEAIAVGRRLRLPLRPLMAACGLDECAAAALLGLSAEGSAMAAVMTLAEEASENADGTAVGTVVPLAAVAGGAGS